MGFNLASGNKKLIHWEEGARNDFEGDETVGDGWILSFHLRATLQGIETEDEDWGLPNQAAFTQWASGILICRNPR